MAKGIYDFLIEKINDLFISLDNYAYVLTRDEKFAVALAERKSFPEPPSGIENQGINDPE